MQLQIASESSSRVVRRRPHEAAEARAVGLGWFSLGLGLAQVLAPRRVARLIGAPESPFACAMMRAFGAREVAVGLGIIAQPRPDFARWARVAGDIVDVALFLSQLTNTRRHRGRWGVATAAALGAAVLDTKAALDATRARRGRELDGRGVHVTHSVTIRATPGQIYGFWRNLENLPKFMSHLESVTAHNGKSMWRAKAPAGRTVEWLAEIVADHPNSLISWRSLPGSEIPNQGSVRFRAAPGNRGTEVHVQLIYQPPGGAWGARAAKLFGEEPKQQIKSDLRRLKQVMETGEVLHSDVSIHSGAHPAQPSERSCRYPEVASPLPAHVASGAPARQEPAYHRPGSMRPLSLAAPPKPTSYEPAVDDQRTAISDAPNDAIPYTHFTNQGSGTTRDDDAS